MKGPPAVLLLFKIFELWTVCWTKQQIQDITVETEDFILIFCLCLPGKCGERDSGMTTKVSQLERCSFAESALTTSQPGCPVMGIFAIVLHLIAINPQINR